MKAEYDVWTGGLDEQGLPYFKDPDWTMLIKEHFGDAAEEEKVRTQSMHGNTVSVHDKAICSNDNVKTAKGRGIGLRSVTVPTGYGESAHGNVESVSGNGQISNGNTTGVDGQMDESKDHEDTYGHVEKSADGPLGRGKDNAKSAQCEEKARKEAKSTQAPMLETPRRSGRINKKSPVRYA